MGRNDQWVGGAILIAIGIALLLGKLFGDMGQFILLGIGLVLLLLFAVSRNPGTLIGGSIVTGLGAGVLVNMHTSGDIADAAVVLGLGFGFVGAWLVGYLMQIRATAVWPLIPGVILVIVGAGVAAGPEIGRQLEVLWPILLIALGVIVVLAGLRRRDSPGGGQPRPG